VPGRDGIIIKIMLLVKVISGTMVPLAPVEDSCDVSYQLFFDEFEVRGKNLDVLLLSVDGGNLVADLGAVVKLRARDLR
jgi:hypothetical protein